MAKKDTKAGIADAIKATGSANAAGKMLSDKNQDLDQGNIRPTGVGLREGEIQAVDALGAELGAMLESEPIARNALIRIAVRRLIVDLRSGAMSYDDLGAYFTKPKKPKLKLDL
jgi:hypothetical protein